MTYQVSVRRKPFSSSSSLYGAPGEMRKSMARQNSASSGMLRAGPPPFGAPQSHQEAMQGLNERLSGYVDRVRGLETANKALEDEIAELTARRTGPLDRDWEPYEKPQGELRMQVKDLNMDNAKLLLHIDNARLAADDFKVKLETEQAICDGVQRDTQGLRKMIDDTNLLRSQLESELEAIKEDLAQLRKNHQQEVEALKALIAKSNVTVVDEAPKNQDLNAAIAEIRKQYEKMAEENKAKAANLYKDKFDNMSQDVSKNTEALEHAKSEVTELRRQMQSLQLEGQNLQKTVDSLARTLRDTEDQYGRNLNQLNQILQRLQEELAACRGDIERQVRDYEALLDLKTKLENEINHYHQLLEGAMDGKMDSSVHKNN